jgi:hypothetical protein
MKQHFFRGLLASAALAVGLTGCVSMPKQQAFNRDAHANLKNVSVLETHKTNTSVFMLNNPGMSFGLIGGLIAAGDQASKEKKFRAIMTEANFEPLVYFKERLTTHMGERGYTLVWPESQIEKTKIQRGSFGLRKAYTAVQNVDAQLDINFGFVGYAAAGAGDGAPYRPTVTIGARLVTPDGKDNLYTDYFAYNNVFNLANAVALNASRAEYTYPGFDDLEKAGPTAVEGLKVAIDTVAAEVARQL